MPPLLGRLLVASLLLAPLPATAATLVLDAMTDALPPNPCLPASQQRVVFAGPYCDGTACPPGSIVMSEPGPPDCTVTQQFGLAGVFGGARLTGIQGEYTQTDTTTARVNPAARVMEVATRHELGSGATLVYDGGGNTWNRDLSAASEFRLEFGGDITPERPLLVSLLLGTSEGDGTGVDQLVTSPGAVVIPFSAFQPWGDTFDFTSVDWINLTVMDCVDPELGCPPVSAGHNFTIGPIAIETDLVTTSKRTSWGSLKVRYR